MSCDCGMGYKPGSNPNQRTMDWQILRDGSPAERHEQKTPQFVMYRLQQLQDADPEARYAAEIIRETKEGRATERGSGTSCPPCHSESSHVSPSAVAGGAAQRAGGGRAAWAGGGVPKPHSAVISPIR